MVLFGPLALHFGKRGAEGWRGMSKTTLVISVDDQGEEFLEYNACEKQKNHTGDVSAASYKPEARVYARPGNTYCPVTAYKKYVGLLHSDLDALWQRPNNNWMPNQQCFWYYKSPLGQSTINKMLKTMSEEAKLSKVYTNHCLRATASKG